MKCQGNYEVDMAPPCLTLGDYPHGGNKYAQLITLPTYALTNCDSLALVVS